MLVAAKDGGAGLKREEGMEGGGGGGRGAVVREEGRPELDGAMFCKLLAIDPAA